MQVHSILQESLEHPSQPISAGQYQLLIKLAEARRTKPQRRAYAFVAVNMQGAEMFSRVNCNLANTTIGALLEAMVEVVS